jgi:PAS domain S-box-containing protein
MRLTSEIPDQASSRPHEREEIEQLFESGPLGMLRLDAEDRILSANTSARTMMGLSEKMILGSPLTELIPVTDLPVFQSLRQTLHEGILSHVQGECRLARLNRTPLHGMFTAFAMVREDDGHPDLMLIIQDITERKEEEKRKKEAEEQWRALWVNVPDQILELDRDHRIVLSNHESPDSESAVGESFLKFTQPDRSEAVRRTIEEAWRTGEIAHYEVESPSREGSRWWANRVIPVVENGRVVRMLHIGTDITAVKEVERERGLAQKRLEERVESRTRELRAALVEKEVLLREIHHRVKNNLQIISSLLRLQARRLDDATIGQVFLESQRRIESMAKIHEYLYRSDHLQVIDFHAYLRDLGHQLLQAYDRGELKVALEITGGNVDLSVDEAIPCGLIFSEAVSNSLKHAFPGGRAGAIEVTLDRPDPGRLSLMIRDNGRGFPAGFDPGRVDSLGLKLVHQLAHQLNGSLEVFSSDGAAIRMTFPFGGERFEGDCVCPG